MHSPQSPGFGELSQDDHLVFTRDGIEEIFNLPQKWGGGGQQNPIRSNRFAVSFKNTGWTKCTKQVKHAPE
jgi:hypothetical protein